MIKPVRVIEVEVTEIVVPIPSVARYLTALHRCA